MRSPQHGLSPEELDQVEELGDEAIIAQQTAAHAPQPRANVSEESRSVVITEHPAPPAAEPRNTLPKSSSEATLVIRDRRALDEMRQKILRKQQEKRAQGRRALYLWGALGLAAFVLGGIVAFLATDTSGESETADSQHSAPGAERQVARPSAPLARPVANGSVASPAGPRQH